MRAPSIRSIPGAASLLALLAACNPAAGAPSYTYPPVGQSATAPAAASAGAPALAVAIATAPTPTPQPALTFTPGTKSAPRVVAISVDDLLNFTPGLVQVAVGETVTFRIHNLGKAVHEFMVGPEAAVFADKEGTPEVADIAAGTTAEVTYAFTGKGPFAFACHAPSHFEHGMLGYIQLVGPGAPLVGTKTDPRLVHVDMTDGLKFVPDQIAVTTGETIRFILTNSGSATHEFQVGPADKVAADDVDGVVDVEVDKLDAGSTTAVDYTFTGTGQFAFACHMPAHYEAGMKGTIGS